MTSLELELNVQAARENLAEAIAELAVYERKAENNVYATLEEAYELEDKLADRAFDDCQGAHNCGDCEYRQAFMVDGVESVAIYTPEYNRHDKTYYYIDGSDFRIEKK